MKLITIIKLALLLVCLLMPGRIFSMKEQNEMSSEVTSESSTESSSESQTDSSSETSVESSSETSTESSSQSTTEFSLNSSAYSTYGTFAVDENNAKKALKFLFMYKYPPVQSNKGHKLNVFTYKNVLFSDDQIVFFESTNEGDPVRIKNNKNLIK